MIRVRESAIIDAPLPEVWRLLRDFNSHDRWHPVMVSSRIEQGRASEPSPSSRTVAASRPGSRSTPPPTSPSG